MQQIATIIHQINEFIGRAASWLTILLVTVVCADVFFRRVLGSTKIWVIELETYIFALIFLLGAARAFKYDRHVRVDVFYSKMSKKDKALVNLLGGILFLLPWCILLIYTSTQFTYTSFIDGENSANPGGLPFRWIIKAAIPVGFLLLMLQGIANIIEAWIDYNSSSKTSNLKKLP